MTGVRLTQWWRRVIQSGHRHPLVAALVAAALCSVLGLLRLGAGVTPATPTYELVVGYMVAGFTIAILDFTFGRRGAK